MQFTLRMSYIREVNNSVLSLLKYLVTPLRRKPDYLIIGAQKSGTSTLFRLLSEHPDIQNPYTKELHYFDQNFNRPFYWYKSHFPIDRGKITGEATPIYLFHPAIPLRVQTHLPKTKFIVILRNPVDRAYSHYQMSVRKKIETLSFEDAINAEPSRIKEASLNPSGTNSQISMPLKHYSYLSRGKYYNHLTRWFALFPQSQFHILSFEDLLSNTQYEYDRICDFLNVCHIEDISLPKLNSDSYSEMHTDTRALLNGYFSQSNKELMKLIRVEFPWSD